MDAEIANQVLGKIAELKSLVEHARVVPPALPLPAGAWHKWPNENPAVDGGVSDYCLTWTKEYGYDLAQWGQYLSPTPCCWRSLKGARTFKEKEVWWMPLPVSPEERSMRFR